MTPFNVLRDGDRFQRAEVKDGRLVVDVDDGDVDVGHARQFGVADAAVERRNFEEVVRSPAYG